MIQYDFPCTGMTKIKGFGSFLDHELSLPRKNLSLFAEELRTLLNVEHISLVNSGSSANLVSAITLKELNPDRKKVITSAFTFPTTISAFQLLGFEVELVDVEKDSFNISEELLLDQINESVAGVCITHFLGFPVDLRKISKKCKEYGVLLIQDACETMNLESHGKTIYEFGDLITHSFYHPHHLSSFGGGAIISRSIEIQKIIESIIHWGRACICHYDKNSCTAPNGLDHNFWYIRKGINVELSELNACFGRFQLLDWKKQEKERNRNYNILFESLKSLDNIRLFENTNNISPFVFPIIVHNGLRDDLIRSLLSRGVEARSIMGGAIYRHPAYKELDNGSLINASTISDSSFFVGIHQTLSSIQIKRISEVFIEVYNSYA